MIIRDEFKTGYKFPLENVKVEWCYFVTPDTKFGKSEWKCTIRLEEALAKSMKDSGFNVRHSRWKDMINLSGEEYKRFKTGDEEYYHIVATTKTVINGQQMNPPKVVSEDGETPFDGSKIGNGSTLNLNVYAKYCEVNGQTYLPLRLNEVQVVDLVEYSGTGFKPVGQAAAAGAPSSLPF